MFRLQVASDICECVCVCVCVCVFTGSPTAIVKTLMITAYARYFRHAATRMQEKKLTATSGSVKLSANWRNRYSTPRLKVNNPRNGWDFPSAEISSEFLVPVVEIQS